MIYYLSVACPDLFNILAGDHITPVCIGFIRVYECEEFRGQFRRSLLSVSERLFSGEIKAQQKKRGNDYDSCRYCDYASVCLKNIRI